MKNKNTLISLFGLAVIGILIYWINIRGGFVFDDYKVIVLNPAVRHLGDIASIWRFDPTRFLPSLTFAFNYRISGLETFTYHLFNLFFHIMAGWTVYWLINLLMRTPAMALKTDHPARQFWPFLAAMIFMVHPLQTSSVSYIVQRSTVMFSLFYLLSLASYLRWRIKPGRIFLYVAFLSAFLGSFCKPTMITLPLSVVFLEIFFLKGKPDENKKLKIERLSVLLGFSLIALMIPILGILLKELSAGMGTFVSLTRQTGMVSRWEYLITQFNVMIYYVGLLFMPLSQNLDYGFPFAEKFFQWPTFFSFAVLWFVLYMVFYWRQKKIFSFAVLWFFVTLLPESSIFPLEDALFEHRLYLPMAGFALGLSYLIVFRIPWKYFRLGASLAVILFFTVLAVNRNALWSQPEMLLKDNINKSPAHLRPRFNLSSYYLREGDLEKARLVIDEAVGIAPWHPDNYYKLAVINEMSGDIESAQQNYQRAIDLNPDIARGEYYLKRAQYFVSQGRWEDAEPLLKQALERTPKSDVINTEIGNLYNLRGEFDQAFGYYQRAIEFNSHNENALNGLATIYVMRQEYDRAIEIYQRLIKTAPEMDLAYINLAKTYYLKRDWGNARDAFTQALIAGVDDPEIYVRLAQINISLQNYQDAQDQMVKAIYLYRDRGFDGTADQLQQQYFANGLPPN